MVIQDQAKVNIAISYVEGKLLEVKRTLEDLLNSLEAQNKVSW